MSKLPKLPDLPNFEEVGESDEFVPSDEIEFEEDLEYDDTEYEEDFGDYEDYEDDYEGDEELLSFLPPADVEEVPIPEEDLDEFDQHMDDFSNEIDEEGVKNFFKGLSSKFSRKPKHNKSNKIKKKSKKGPIVVSVITLLIIVLAGAFAFIKLSSQYAHLNDVELEVTSDNNHVELYDFRIENDILNARVKNIGDMSAEFVIDLNVTTRGKLPIDDETFLCTSEIVVLDLDGTDNVSFTCMKNMPEDGIKVSAKLEDLD